MTKSVVELATIGEAVLYWKDRLKDRGDKNDMRIAGRMVNLAANGRFDTWYQGQGLPEFTEVFDLVASLEVPNGVTEIGNEAMRKAAWERVEHLLKALEVKHPD